ncbi:hypothetical protein PCA31118_01204 [Pandoraea captiosa]|uniref:Uncharacterized protein n=1 Tax=Pandoraea captiosa TaxID=2508302 RepID=A0A5E4ZR24_9BURK|nr:hypothetical protein PCA31118_01204 [Pandoraea captiosa]
MKKPWEQMLRETFTKTLTEKYDEATRSQRAVYWMTIVVVCLVIVTVLVKYS